MSNIWCNFADNYIGNIKTISYFCILYTFGWIGITVTSLSLPGVSLILLVSLSLLFISIANGSIRACITSLGAMQFKVPEQNSSLDHYFSHYYFVYYLGIFLSKILPPFIRANTSCFNKTQCYPAVFGTLGVAFLISWFIFLIGKFFYKREIINDESIVLKFYGCVKYGLIEKFKNRKSSNQKQYWLHYSIDRYSEEFVNDVTIFFQVVKLLPLPIYYALLAQQDSSWTFQATQMNTTIIGISIEPDQAKAMGPIFLFLMIPLWQYIFVPILRKFDISLHPLNSVIIGAICSALAFLCAGVLQIEIEENEMKSLNILWQIPQFVLLMMGELFLSIPGLQFAFTQAPESMKSILTAAWFLNNAFGNLIVVFLTEIKVFQSQSTEYFMYATIMLICIAIFATLAFNYMKKCQRNTCFHQNHIT